MRGFFRGPQEPGWREPGAGVKFPVSSDSRRQPTRGAQQDLQADRAANRFTSLTLLFR